MTVGGWWLGGSMVGWLRMDGWLSGWVTVAEIRKLKRGASRNLTTLFQFLLPLLLSVLLTSCVSVYLRAIVIRNFYGASF